MVKIGKNNKLQVVKFVEFGIYLNGGQDGEILMPSRYVPDDCKINDWLDVFIYLDSEDRLLATDEKPYVYADEFASLKCVAITQFGAFLDWGLPKDLLVPYKEQAERMIEGKNYVVYVYEDSATGRIVATSKIEKYLDKIPQNYEFNQKVELLVYQRTDLGYKVVIEKTHSGLIFYNQIFRKLAVGDKVEGFIKEIREDGKIDVVLEKQGYVKVEGIAQDILNIIKNNGGSMKIHDKSPSEEIYEVFGVSKKTFKKAIGDLYRNRMIVIEEEGIRQI
jgi:uncharacterized protein